jgi:hypothetical protein
VLSARLLVNALAAPDGGCDRAGDGPGIRNTPRYNGGIRAE